MMKVELERRMKEEKQDASIAAMQSRMEALGRRMEDFL